MVVLAAAVTPCGPSSSSAYACAGPLGALMHHKDPVPSVKLNMECGASFADFTDLQAVSGDCLAEGHAAYDSVVG